MRTSPCSTPSCATRRSRFSIEAAAMAMVAPPTAATRRRRGRRAGPDLQPGARVEPEAEREEGRGAIEVALDHRATPESAAPAADAEGAGEPGVFPGVQQDQEDQRAGDDHLEKAEERVHGPDGSGM